MIRKPNICNNSDGLTTLTTNFGKKNQKDLEDERLKYLFDNAAPKTSNVYQTYNLPKKFESPHVYAISYGVNNDKRNPLYKTVNSQYGYFPPNVHTVPTKYYPRGQKFSNVMAKFGMYNDYTLNTSFAQ